MTTEFSMSVLGGERQNWMTAILAFVMRMGPPAALETFCEKTRPWMSSVSSTVPPSFCTTLMLLRSALLSVAGSAMLKTASTARGASRLEFCDTTLEQSDVVVHLMSVSLSAKSTGIAMLRMISSALVLASWKASEIWLGCSPRVSSVCTAFNSPPASTTTLVVPSPASMSCDLDSSTIIFAAGWLTLMCRRIVAPSLVMITSPLCVSIILSIPRGPSDVRTASEMALPAMMLEDRTSSCCRLPASNCVPPSRSPILAVSRVRTCVCSCVDSGAVAPHSSPSGSPRALSRTFGATR
mmetsp:Transcript_22440/g.56634  ORF Transcript_22440/g.56634 Transcript_22440/m.56634 type:complete len:296 (+) Transcript_22440:1040-1927(+)